LKVKLKQVAGLMREEEFKRWGKEGNWSQKKSIRQVRGSNENGDMPTQTAAWGGILPLQTDESPNSVYQIQKRSRKVREKRR